MSAYMVEDIHIQVLVGAGLEFNNNRMRYFKYPFTPQDDATTKSYLAYVEQHERMLTLDTADEVGEMLQQANIASLGSRYADGWPFEDGLPRTFKFDRSKINCLDPVKMLGAIRCFDYQACEVEHHQLTEYFGYLEALQTSCIDRIKDHYDATIPWSVSELDDVRLDEFKGRNIHTLSQLLGQ